MKRFTNLLLTLTILALYMITGSANAQKLPGFDTDLEKRSINLDELIDGGPGNDGIPSIDDPRFISQEEASGWLHGREPVEGFAKPGFLVKIKARGILKPQHIEHM